MKILTFKYLSWWQVGVLILAIMFLGISIGAYGQSVLTPYAGLLFFVGLILFVFVSYLRFKKPDWRNSTRLMYF